MITRVQSLEIDFQQQNISLLIKFVDKRCTIVNLLLLQSLLALELPQIAHSVHRCLINREPRGGLLTQLSLKKLTPKRKNAYFETETFSLNRYISIQE